MTSRPFNLSVSGMKATANLDTAALFNVTYREPTRPPIDLFFDNVALCARILGAPPNPIDEEWKYLANLTLLGVVSGVETYFRRVIREILRFDKESQNNAYSKTLTYGAALHHSKELLPEALLEDTSFIKKENISKCLNSFLGISLNQSPSVIKALNDYELVCNLRHCIVHRSGKFGSKNAIKFGLTEHSNFIEKPIDVAFQEIHQIFQICASTVQEVNDCLFQKLLIRSGNQISWKNDLRKDKRKLKKYFDLFTRSNLNQPILLKNCHRQLMNKIYVS